MERQPVQSEGEEMTNNPADTLKACPFCQSENEPYIQKLSSDCQDEYRICCGDGNCNLNSPWFETEEEAITYWNTRAPSEKPTGDRMGAFTENEIIEAIAIVKQRFMIREHTAYELSDSYAAKADKAMNTLIHAAHPAPVTEEG